MAENSAANAPPKNDAPSREKPRSNPERVKPAKPYP